MPMTSLAELVDAEVARHDPVRRVLSDAARSPEASELLGRILGIDYRTAAVPSTTAGSPGNDAGRTRARSALARSFVWLRRPKTLRPRLTLAIAALLVAATVAATLSTVVGGGIDAPFSTPWQPARALPAASSTHERAGTWRLVDALLTGTWEQNVFGPPPGLFSCAPDGTCYVLAGHYPSPAASAPVLSESLYAGAGDGATWSALPLPTGLVPMTPLECSGQTWCAAGATFQGQPVLAVTRDGGHSFTIDPLPTGVGTLRALSCPSSGVCMGLASISASETTANDVTFLVTDDGGSAFHDEPIRAGSSMVDLACTSNTDCTVVGSTDASMNDTVPVGVSAVTTDQGRSWAKGSFPVGFSISADDSSLACVDAQHCFVTGGVPIAIQNPPQCASEPNIPKTPPPGTHGLPEVDPKMRAISTMEAGLFAARLAQTISCTNARVELVGDVASTNDGGLSWTPDVLPADMPGPHLNGLSCPTATECWAAGTEWVPDKPQGGSSPVLIGTTDGGSTWSRVQFSVPATAPDDYGQSFISIGSVACPTAETCLARGMAAQGSRYATVYSLVAPGG